MSQIKRAIERPYGIIQTVDCYGVAQYKIPKPFHSAPVIINEYLDKDRVRMYECEGSRHFVASIYDKMFIPLKGKVKPHNYKGTNTFYKKGR